MQGEGAREAKTNTETEMETEEQRRPEGGDGDGDGGRKLREGGRGEDGGPGSLSGTLWREPLRQSIWNLGRCYIAPVRLSLLYS